MKIGITREILENGGDHYYAAWKLLSRATFLNVFKVKKIAKTTRQACPSAEYLRKIDSIKDKLLGLNLRRVSSRITK